MRLYQMQIAYWVLASIILAGCATMQSANPSLESMLVEADSTLDAANRTVANALAIGTLTVDSRTYKQVYAGLEAANKALDRAWEAYESGNSVQAAQGRRAAMDAYLAVRPFIQELAR